MQTRNRLTLFPALGAIAAAAALIACSDPQDPRTAGEQLDATVAKVEQKAEEAKADVKAAGEDAKQAVTQAADTVTDKARDATITAAVNAELAKDKDLSVLGINVDTSAGRVALYGKAPSAAARERATAIAAAVDGVASVDNRLVVAPSS